MAIVNCKADLNRLVAESAFCKEPPLSQRRAYHESGAWRWVRAEEKWVDSGVVNSTFGSAELHLDSVIPAHWCPAPFATDPAASYALENEMIRRGWHWHMKRGSEDWMVYRVNMASPAAYHPSRLIALCLATLRTLGVEFTLAEGWDAR